MMNQAEVDALKATIKDPAVLAFIAELEMQNDRLHSHHSACKKELGDLVETANTWRIRSFVLDKLLTWLNGVSPWWYPDDLRKEIEIHVEQLTAAWRRREPWWLSWQ